MYIVSNARLSSVWQLIGPSLAPHEMLGIDKVGFSNS